MAKDDKREEAWERRRRREQEDEEEQEAQRGVGKSSAIGGAAASGDTAALDALISRAEAAIERVNGLYLQFLSGYERMPPVQARKELEDLMSKLHAAPKPQPAYRFRAQTIISRFTTYRERWDKSMKDFEAGRIKRPAGPQNRK